MEEKKSKAVKELLLESFENLPEDIRKCEHNVLGFSNAISTTESEMKEQEYFTMAAISREKDITVVNDERIEKKKYTNDAGRNAELNKRLAKHKEYIENRKVINETKNLLAKEKIYLNYLNNKFSACKHITKLLDVKE